MQVVWHDDDVDGNLTFTSVASDGRVTNWTVVKTEIRHTDIVRLALDETATAAAVEPLLGLGSGTCLAFHPHEHRLFLVGTEEGDVHLCSKAYTSKFIATFKAHTMAVYAVRWSPFHPNIFATCSADWTVKIWDKNDTATPIFAFDLGNAVPLSFPCHPSGLLLDGASPALPLTRPARLRCDHRWATSSGPLTPLPLLQPSPPMARCAWG